MRVRKKHVWYNCVIIFEGQKKKCSKMPTLSLCDNFLGFYHYCPHGHFIKKNHSEPFPCDIFFLGLLAISHIIIDMALLHSYKVHGL